jgi:predicted CopG family antitoxin
LVAKKTHAIQRKNPNIHQLLKKKKKRLSAPKQFGNTKKKKRSKEKESFNDLNWDLIEQKRGMD